MDADELIDRFAPDADMAQLAQLPLDILTFQIEELRHAHSRVTLMTDGIDMTSRQIAKAIREYARLCAALEVPCQLKDEPHADDWLEAAYEDRMSGGEV